MRRRYIVMVWHQDDLTRIPEVSGFWWTFEAAEEFADAVMKCDEKLVAEAAPLYGERVRRA